MHIIVTMEVFSVGIRVRKSIKIAPGVNLNLGKKSAGISFGTKGARYSINSSGRKTATVGIPGTGISYSASSRKKHSNAQAKKKQLERELAKAEKEKQKQLELEHAKAAVEEYEAKIDAITTIHRSCADVIPWGSIVKTTAPFELGEQGPREVLEGKMQKHTNQVSLQNIFVPLMLLQMEH